jgi:hypothetical protein
MRMRLSSKPLSAPIQARKSTPWSMASISRWSNFSFTMTLKRWHALGGPAAHPKVFCTTDASDKTVESFPRGRDA